MLLEFFIIIKLKLIISLIFFLLGIQIHSFSVFRLHQAVLAFLVLPNFLESCRTWFPLLLKRFIIFHLYRILKGALSPPYKHLFELFSANFINERIQFRFSVFLIIDLHRTLKLKLYSFSELLLQDTYRGACFDLLYVITFNKALNLKFYEFYKAFI